MKGVTFRLYMRLEEVEGAAPRRQQDNADDDHGRSGFTRGGMREARDTATADEQRETEDEANTQISRCPLMTSESEIGPAYHLSNLERFGEDQPLVIPADLTSDIRLYLLEKRWEVVLAVMEGDIESIGSWRDRVRLEQDSVRPFDGF